MTNYDLIAGFQVMADEHWAYVANAAVKGRVDCSGAFVYEFSKYDLSISHGSNSMWRLHMVDKGQIGHIEMVPGMAVFKRRLDGGEPDKYKGDGIGNYYHVGLYIGPTAKFPEGAAIEAKGTDYGVVVTSISSGWTHAGKLKQVTYQTKEDAVPQTAIVVAPKGETVNMRKKAESGSDLVARVPIGDIVIVLEQKAEWSSVKAFVNGKYHTGWMANQYLNFTQEETPPQDASTEAFKRVYDRLGELYTELGTILGVNG